MNTDATTPMDFLTCSVALEEVVQATTREALCAAMEKITAAVGRGRFLLLHLEGNSNEVSSVLHNLASPPAFDAPGVQAVVRQTLSGGHLPHIDELAIPGLKHASISMLKLGTITSVLIFGGEAPIEAMSQVDLLAMTSLASNYATSALSQIQKAECQLAPRELECLTFAGAGCSAKETSRYLGLSPRTVEEYLLRCRERMEVKTTLAALATAVRRGWISSVEIDAANAIINRQYAAHPGP